jgi:hypothetical protein
MKNSTKHRAELKSRIKEYSGTEYYFLIDYLDGGYESYVDENLEKIVEKKSFGRIIRRPEYKNYRSHYELKCRVLEICENTLVYLKKSGLLNKEV